MGKLMEKWRALVIWQQAIIIVAIVAIVVFALISLKPDTTEVLYSNLDTKEALEIQTEVSKMGLKSTLSTDGTSISMEASEIPKVQAYLASMGLPSTGDPGFELFDTSTMGDTEFDKERKYERALVGDIEQGLVQGFDFIDKAVVQLNFKMKGSMFEEDQKSKASVTIRLKGNQELKDEQVKAIKNFVASSVRNLSADNVEVMDKNGIVYDDSSDTTTGGGYTKQMQIVDKTEERIRNDIMKTMAKVFGADNVTLNVRAKINFDEIVQNIQKYDPDGTLVSREKRTEDTSKSDNKNSEEPGTDNNGEVPDYQLSDGTAEQAYEQKKEELIENFEVGKTVETIKKNPELSYITVTATINKSVSQAQMNAFVNEWEEIVTNAAGIEKNADGTLKNGSVKISPQTYLPDNANKPNTDGQGASDKDKLMYVQFFIYGGLLLVVVALLVWLFYKKKPKEEKSNDEKKVKTITNVTNVKNVKNVTTDDEVNEEYIENEVNQNEKRTAKSNELSQQLEEKIEGINSKGEADTEALATSVQKIAEEDPEGTAKYLKKLIKEG